MRGGSANLRPAPGQAEAVDSASADVREALWELGLVSVPLAGTVVTGGCRDESGHIAGLGYNSRGTVTGR